MRSTLKFLLALVVAFLLMLAFRGLVMTIYTVDGNGLSPVFHAGDRVVVNRWSYGLRTGQTDGLFDYGRLCRQPVERGDLIAFEDSLGQVFICRCTALPGDTLGQMVVPSLANCADQDYYWVEPVGKKNPLSSRQLGFIPEERIIGRACLILYNHQPGAPLWKGYDSQRLLLPTAAFKNAPRP